MTSRDSLIFAEKGPKEKSGKLTPGDAALLRFAAAAEILETDFWVQYNELGGVPNTSEVPGGSGNPAYTAALQVLDMEMPQYIHDNADDEFTHQNFLNAYLVSANGPTLSAADSIIREVLRPAFANLAQTENIAPCHNYQFPQL